MSSTQAGLVSFSPRNHVHSGGTSAGLSGSSMPLLRCALLNNGVDCAAFHGWISAMHTDADVERTVQGYERAFQAMAADGAFKGL